MPYIPVFGKQEDVSGTVYLMLGEFGGGGGSIEVNFDLPNIQSCVLKVYPKVIHYIKARNIGVDLPTTVKGIQSHVGAIEEMLMDLHDDQG